MRKVLKKRALMSVKVSSYWVNMYWQMLMIKVENFDDVSVQVVERLRVHESLVDILLETTDVKSVVENLPKIGGDRRSQRGGLFGQGGRDGVIYCCNGKGIHITA